MRYLFNRIFALALLGTCCSAVSAQTVSYRVEGTGALSGGSFAPFWHTANRQGLGSVETRSGYLRAAAVGESNSQDGAWHFTYGLDLVAGHNLASHVLMQQGYGEVEWRMWRLTLGQKERTGELKNPLLSTGGLTESGNARPVPQLRLEVPDYWDLFHTHGWFTLRGHVAYGMFTDGGWQQDFAAAGTRYAKNVLYHSKALFLKGGNDKEFPLTAVWGLQMATQFGGTIYNCFDKAGNTLHMQSRPVDFFKALVPLGGDSKTSVNDQGNVEGNHLGSWHVELAWKEENWKVRGYLEHMFEDHSGMFLEYGLWKDGLYGVEVELPRMRWLNNIVLEYFNSGDQAGPIYHDTSDKIPDQISCRDSYYNHDEYPCWQSYGFVLGSPLITEPLYNANGHLTIYNNRVEAFHAGFKGEPLACLGYRVLLTKMRGWGTYAQPFSHIKDDFSGLVELSYRPASLAGWSATASFAWNRGELYGDCGGLMLSVAKTGLIHW